MVSRMVQQQAGEEKNKRKTYSWAGKRKHSQMASTATARSCFGVGAAYIRASNSPTPVTVYRRLFGQ